MRSSLPCFLTFCRSGIPTSCYIFKCFLLLVIIPCTSAEMLRCCSCSAKWYRSVSSNRKVRSTGTRTLRQLKQSQLVCGPQFEFSVPGDFLKPLKPTPLASAPGYHMTIVKPIASGFGTLQSCPFIALVNRSRYSFHQWQTGLVLS